MGRKKAHTPKYPCSQEEFFAGVTIQDAAQLLHYHRETIIYHINRGTLRARKSGRIWLIDLKSIRQLAGEQHPNYAFML